VDQRRGRSYLPLQDLAAHGLQCALPVPDGPALRQCLRDLCAWAGRLMREGAPLAWSLPGRMGWELRLVVLGGLRILEKIERIDHDTLHTRPALGKADVPMLLWRALRPSSLRLA
jgi:phytoene/squalene synthetase